MEKIDILLINPPFAMPDKPCLSVPVLAGYLRARGLSVQVLDLNIEFYRLFLARGERPVSLFDDRTLPYGEKLARFRSALQAASAPYFPEALYFTGNTGYIRCETPYSNFSSAGILQGLRHNALFPGILETVLKRVLKTIRPRAAGISITFPDMVQPAFKCAEIIKAIAPGIHVTMGGAFVSCHMRTVNHPGLFGVVDSIIVDDGERPLERLLEELNNQTPCLDNVPGIIYLSARQKKIIHRAPAPPLAMTQLPPPAYELFPLDSYLANRDSMTLLYRLSRGCYWAKCTFCRTRLPFIHHYDQPPADFLYRQLETLVEQTGIRRFHFTDEAASPRVLDEMSRLIVKNRLKINWGCNLRFDKRLTLQRTMSYKRAGCYAVSLGLESYSDRILKLMRKGFTTDLVPGILDNFSWAGIAVSLYMIVGFPTETGEEALASFERVMALKEKKRVSHCVYNVFELVPYSVISAAPENFGITGIPVLKDRDLDPPRSRFQGSGMTREKAFELCRRFVGRWSGNREG